MKITALTLGPIATAVILLVSHEAWAQGDESTDQEAAAAGIVSLPTVDVVAEGIENRLYTREEMDATAGGNRDIAKLVETHPAVRLNPIANNGNRGSLAVEDFSIHGESPYQNQFLIDGISGVNMITPQESVGSQQVDQVVGFSQAYNIDTDVLDQVQVLDNRVPVEFGRFQGGVINAKIKNPVGSNKFSLKRSFNSSGLTEQKMSENLNEDWENGKPGYAAEWKKNFTSLNGDIRLSERSNMLLSFSKRESLIVRQARKLDLSLPDPSAGDQVLVKDQESDTVDNLMLKFRTQWDAKTSSSILVKYADRKEDLVSNTSSNQNWTNQQKASGLGFDFDKALALGSLEVNIGMDQLDSMRESDSNVQVTQNFMRTATAIDATKTYTYGGLGSAALKQKQYSAKARLNINPFFIGTVQHKIYFGVDAQKVEASFERDEDVHVHTYRRLLNGMQQHYNHYIYQAGSVNVGYNSLGVYLSETAQLGNWSWTTSGRWDRDNFLKNNNFSPRTRLDWNVGGRDSTLLGIGWSRYYGLDIIGYALEEGKDKLYFRKIQAGNVVNSYPGYANRKFDELKTPHSDEAVFSLIQKISSETEASISYVKRNSKDEISQSGTETAGYRYENTGSGKTETIALTLKNIKPWKKFGADWITRLDYSWQDVQRSQDSTLGWAGKGLLPDDEITVDGVKMLRKDKPTSIFHQPRRASLGVTGKWRKSGFTWGNRLNWLSSKQQLVATNTNYNTYKTYKIPSNWTWDASLTYKPSHLKGMMFNLDIINVLNKITSVATTRTAITYTPRMETGREIWLNVGYEF